MKFVTCAFCESDDVALQDSKKLDTVVTKKHNFITRICTFFCHACGSTFNVDLDDDDRKEYL